MTLRIRAFTPCLLAVAIAACAENATSPIRGTRAATVIVDDVQVPTLASLTFTPASVNATDAEAQVQVTARITDDLAGTADDLMIQFNSPGDLQFRFAFLHRTEGTALDGIYTATVTFPRFSQAGEWRLGLIVLRDLASNTRFLVTADIQALGISTALQVTSLEDTQVPVLAGLSFTPASINTTSGDAQVQVTARITDDVAGTSDDLMIQFNSPGDLQYRFAFLHRTAGTELDGTYTATLTFPRFSQAGEWRLGLIILRDLANNTRFLVTPDIQALGFPTMLEVTSVQDVQVPVLASVTFTPTSINTTSGEAQVQVTARITDDIAGTSDDLMIQFNSPGDLQYQFSFLHRIAGTELDGTYTATVTFPRFSQAGEWRLGLVILRDLANNTRFLVTPELQAMGFNTTLHVVGLGSEPPSPATAVERLIAAVRAMELAQATIASLIAPLQNIDVGNQPAACGKLGAFTNQVNAKLRNGDVTATQAAQLLTAAQVVSEALECARKIK